MKELVVGHVLVKTVQSNWKVFWENYNECLHCPSVHPKLSNLVPIFGRGLLEERDAHAIGVRSRSVSSSAATPRMRASPRRIASTRARRSPSS